MKKIELGKYTIAASANRQTIEKWNKLEAYVVGKKCDNLDDLINGLYEHWVSNTGQSNDQKPSQIANNEELEAANKKIIKLQNELEQAKESIMSFEQRLSEKDAKIQSANETIAQQKDDIQNQSTTISNLVESTISSAVYVETAGYKHQTSDIILQNLEQQLEHLLSLVGITPMTEIGLPFDNRFQKIITIQETDDPTKNNIVVETLGKGFRKGDLCLKEQEVVIYQYKENTK